MPHTFEPGDRWKILVKTPKPHIRFFHPTGEIQMLYGKPNYKLVDGSFAGEPLMNEVMATGEYSKVGSEPDDYECKECRVTVNQAYWSYGDKLKAEQLCFYCSLWTERLRKYSNPRVFVINANFYSYNDDLAKGTPKSFAGFGGSRFNIHPLDGRPDVTTHNLWHGGQVPEHFRDRLVNNAWFVVDTRPIQGYAPQQSLSLNDVKQTQDETRCLNAETGQTPD